MPATQKTSRVINKPAFVFGAVIVLWLGYTVLQTRLVIELVSENWNTIIGFIPGISGFVRIVIY